MRTFELHRIEDETGVSGTGIVAQGCVFDDGWVVMRWVNEPHTTTLFESIQDVEHIHGHHGKTQILYTSGAYSRDVSSAYAHGARDAYQDRCEGVWSASVRGGSIVVGTTVPRSEWFAPGYIAPADREQYLAGYEAQSMHDNELKP